MSTRRTGYGRYRPSSHDCLTLGQCTLSQSVNSATDPRGTFVLDYSLARQPQVAAFNHPLQQVVLRFRSPGCRRAYLSTECRALDFRPAPCLSVPPAGVSASPVRFEITRPTPGVVVRPFDMTAYYGLR